MLYPFIFKPILKDVLWGGFDIRPFKGMTPNRETIGESWEISHVDDHYSIVANGALKGKSLDELMRTYGPQLTGGKTTGRFPLLVKFIDAYENLSIQVHPGDELAQKRHHSLGKTEMWYVIKATGDASLYSGFSRPMDAAEYIRRMEENSIMEVLQRYEVKEGDVFFLPAGRVHAIGAGCLMAEIQQTSDITYRIYDFDRKDAHGNSRELHTGLAKDAIDYRYSPDYRTHYSPQKNTPVSLISCPYFTTNLLDLEAAAVRDFSTLDSFVIYICIAGEASIGDNKGNELFVHQGQTVLIPADTQQITISPSPEAKFMETYQQ